METTMEETRKDEQKTDDHKESQTPKAKEPGFFEKNPRAKPIVFFAVLFVLACVVIFWWHSRQWEDTDNAQVDGHIYSVSARVGGHVAKVLVDDGQFVRAGQTLIQIDPTDIQVALDRAQADYADAKANAEAARLGVPISSIGSSTQISGSEAEVMSAEAGITNSQKQVESAQAQVVEAEANAVKLNADVQRYKQLLEKKEIAQQQFDQAVASAAVANATVASRKADVKAAVEQVRQMQARLLQAKSSLLNSKATTQQVAVTKAKAESAAAQVDRSNAALQQAKLNLQYTNIVAPVDGIVGHRSVQVGQNVQANQDLLAVVSQREIWITANFKETQLRLMKPGQPVEIKIDTYGGRKWEGKISQIGGATGARYSLLPPENATGNYVKVVQRIPVRIDLDGSDKPDFNQDGALRVGMSVTPDVKVR